MSFSKTESLYKRFLANLGSYLLNKWTRSTSIVFQWTLYWISKGFDIFFVQDNIEL